MENWKPAREAWATFCRSNPGLGLNGNANSFIWFNRQHGKVMIEAGVMRKALSRTLLINVETFGPLAFEILSGGKQNA